MNGHHVSFTNKNPRLKTIEINENQSITRVRLRFMKVQKQKKKQNT